MTDQGTGEELRSGPRDEAAAAKSGIDVVLVTGLSGAGRGAILADGDHVHDGAPARVAQCGRCLGVRPGCNQIATVQQQLGQP